MPREASLPSVLCIEAQVSPQFTSAQDGPTPHVLARVAAPASSQLPLPRLLLVYAHPDDEVLAMGARLERLRASRLLTLTDGAPDNGEDARHHGFSTLVAYRAARQAELHAALAHAGLPPEVAPAFPQQVSDQQASFHLSALARRIASEVRTFQPDAILTHPYEGGHPDHDACAFAVHAAVQMVAEETDVPVIESPFYHAGENGSMRTGVFLPSHPQEDILAIELTPEEQRNKTARLACFRSQAETLAQFGVERESFRLAPRYDFSRRPHAGQLFYENFPWGMSGDRFCELAMASTKELPKPGNAPLASSNHLAAV